MIGSVTGRTPPSAAAPTSERAAQDAKLRDVAQQMEGVFVQQLYKAMRDTVPQGDGIVSGGAGEEMFTSLLDQHVAAETPRHWSGGLAESLYRQLRRFEAPSAAPELSSPVSTPDLPIR